MRSADTWRDTCAHSPPCSTASECATLERMEAPPVQRLSLFEAYRQRLARPATRTELGARLARAVIDAEALRKLELRGADLAELAELARLVLEAPP